MRLRRTVFLTGLFIILLFIATVLTYKDVQRVFYESFSNRWAAWIDKRVAVKSLKDSRRYCLTVKKAPMTAEVVINRMQRDKGLYAAEPNVVRAVEWHVYHRNSDVINQLIDNLQFDAPLQLVKDGGTNRTHVKGESLRILDNHWYGDDELDSIFSLARQVAPVLHGRLHRFPGEEASPELVFRVLHLLYSNEPQIGKKTKDSLAIQSLPGHFLANTAWYTDELVLDDIKAYVEVYVRYKEWPSIRELVKGHVYHYPGQWHRPECALRILKIADEDGAEPAFQTYRMNFRPREHWNDLK